MLLVCLVRNGQFEIGYFVLNTYIKRSVKGVRIRRYSGPDFPAF